MAVMVRRPAWSSRWLVLGGAALAVIVAGASVVMSFGKSTPAAHFPPPARSDRFDGQQAYDYLVNICRLGTRITDSTGMRRQQRVLREHFEALGAQVELQSFKATQPSSNGRQFICTNLIVHWHRDSQRRVLFGAHYDTRPQADQEPVFRLRSQPFLGANDGASGVALLMEMGRRIASLKLPFGVDFVFFDAEEYILDSRDQYFLGSEHFVQKYVQGQPGYRYEAVVVVDMIADRELEVYPDQRSAARAGALVQEVWSVAAELGVRQFHPEPRHDVLDDHIAFLKAGIPAIDIIDFDYPHWHRLTDTPDKCSAASLDAVGRVLLTWLERRP